MNRGAVVFAADAAERRTGQIVKQPVSAPTDTGAATPAAGRIIPDAASKALARLLTDVGEPMFVLDDEGRFAGASESLLAKLGMRDRELIGRRLSEILVDDGRPGLDGDGPIRLRSRDEGVWSSYLRMSSIDVGKGGRRFRVGVLGVIPENGHGGQPRTGATAGADIIRRERLRQEFNTKLQTRFAAGNGPHVAMAGRIEVICLDDLKETLGSEWARLRDRTMAMARGIIDRRLLPGDIFAETESDSFVLCFATLNAVEARFKSDQIAREIRARLLGEEARPFDVQSQVEQVEFSQPEVAENADLLTTLVAQLDEAREARSQYLQATREQLLKSARLILGPTTAADPSAPPLSLARLGGESASLLSRIVGSDDEAKAICDLDSVMLTLVIKHLFTDHGSRTSMLIVPVHYGTLAGRRFLTDYLSLCERTDGATRKRICFELLDIPRDAPQSRVQDMYARLAPFSACRLMQIDTPTPRLGEVSRFRHAMVALPARREHARTSTAVRAFAAFVGLLHGQGCQVLVRGVPDRPAAEWYIGQQVDYLSLVDRRDDTADPEV
jgi:hypothetical protein